MHFFTALVFTQSPPSPSSFRLTCSLKLLTNRCGRRLSNTFLNRRCSVRPRMWPGAAKGRAHWDSMYEPLAVSSTGLPLALSVAYWLHSGSPTMDVVNLFGSFPETQGEKKPHVPCAYVGGPKSAHMSTTLMSLRPPLEAMACVTFAEWQWSFMGTNMTFLPSCR